MREQYSAPTSVRVSDLKPNSRNVNLVVRVHHVGAAQRIPDRTGGGPDKRVAEALVGDESANVVLSLWNDEIGTVNAGDVVQITGAYVRIVRGHIRLCLPRGVSPRRVDDAIDADPKAPNVSDAEHADEYRPRGPPRSDRPRNTRW